MASFSDQLTLARNGNFQNRVQIAIVTAAIAVANEPPNTSDHFARLMLARHILDSPVTYAERFAGGVVTNATIATTAPSGITATDADIQFAVNSMFTAYAIG